MTGNTEAHQRDDMHLGLAGILLVVVWVDGVEMLVKILALDLVKEPLAQ